MHDQTLPLLLKAEEAARMLSLGRSKVFEMLATGELPRVRIGRKVQIRRVDLEKWVEDHAVDQTDRQLQS